MLGVHHIQISLYIPIRCQATHFLSQHTPLVDSEGQLPFSVQWVDSQGQPPCSVRQGQYPMLEMGSQTYEMQLTPRTTVVLQKLRVRQDEYILVQKKVTKTVVVMAEYTCIVYLYAFKVGRQPSQPHTGCALLQCIRNTPHSALSS